MRLIPGRTKVKIEIFKGLTIPDIAILIITMALIVLVLTASLPGKLYFVLGILLIAGSLVIRLDTEPNYQYILNILRHFASRRKYGRVSTDRQLMLEDTTQGAQEAFDGVFRGVAEEKKESARERRAREKREAAERKAEDRKLKSKTLSPEEREEILEKRRAERARAAQKLAEERDAAMRRAHMQELIAFTDIRNGYIEYDGKYFGAAIEIPPIEFRFFSEMRRNNAIENGLGRVLRALPPEYSANIVKLERPAMYDGYLSNEYAKLEELRSSFEQGLLTESEFQVRVEVLYDRIEELRNLCFGDKVIESFFYLVLFDSDKRQLDNMVLSALDSLHNGEMHPHRLDDKELAVFLKYSYQLDFDEREIEHIAPENYAEWAMPRTVDIKSRTVEINHIVTHNFRMVGYPTVVPDAWIAGVASLPASKVVIKCRPMDRTKAVQSIDRSMQELRGQWAATGIDSKRIELEEHINTLATLLSTLQGDNESLIEVNVYVTAYDIAQTRANTSAVQPPRSALSNITNMKRTTRRVYQEQGFRLNNMEFRQYEAFIGGQISGWDPMHREGRGIPSNTVAAAFPWIFAHVADENGVKLGSADGVPVFIDFFRRDSERVNSNMVIVGKSGSGKSYATKSLLTNLAADDTKIFILDPENEYTELAANLHGKFINVGNAQYGRLNPFQIITALDDEDSDATTESGSYATHLQFLEEFFRQILPDCDKDALEYLNSIVDRMYTNMGITAETDLSRLRPEDYPIFDDLYDAILTEFQASDNSYIHTMLRTLTNHIAKFSTGGRNANIWNGPSSITTDENFTVFNFQSLLANRNGTVANAQMLLVLKYIDNEIIKNRDYNTKYGLNRKIVVVIDEAHVFIDTKFPIALDFMFQLAKRIRKYNGMQIVITQNIKDFVGSEELARKSTAIINACQYSFIFSLAPNDMDDLCTLYEKAGGINEQEQEQIVTAPRGHAFTVLGPQSRSSFRIDVPEDIVSMFKKPGYQSHYFSGEDGAQVWEQIVGDSRDKRAANLAGRSRPGTDAEEDGERLQKKVSFTEISNEELEELVRDFGLRQPQHTVSMPSNTPHGGKGGVTFTEVSADSAAAVPQQTPAPQAGAAPQQIIVQNDHSRMESMLGELLQKLSYDSMMTELRRSVREEVLRELGSVRGPAPTEAPPAAEAAPPAPTPETPAATPEGRPVEAAPPAPVPETPPVEAPASAAAPEVTPVPEAAPAPETQAPTAVRTMLEEYVRAQAGTQPSIFELMRRYHDTVTRITLEELAHHNSMH